MFFQSCRNHFTLINVLTGRALTQPPLHTPVENSKNQLIKLFGRAGSLRKNKQFQTNNLAKMNMELTKPKIVHARASVKSEILLNVESPIDTNIFVAKNSVSALWSCGTFENLIQLRSTWFWDWFDWWMNYSWWRQDFQLNLAVLGSAEFCNWIKLIKLGSPTFIQCKKYTEGNVLKWWRISIR